MPLSPPAPRRPWHTRTIVCEGFARDDGLWDIEARIVDTKPYPYVEPYRGLRHAGEHVHDMVVRLTVGSDFVVRDIEVGMESSPYPDCLKAPARFKDLIGASVGPGWRKRVQAAVGGTAGCTHARELLFPMATVVFQTINAWPEETNPQAPRPFRFEGDPAGFVDGCIGWSRDGEMVATLHPHLKRPRPAQE